MYDKIEGIESYSLEYIESHIEEFVRAQFNINPNDPWFDREVDLFERGYVDSMGVVELLEFLYLSFNVRIPDEDLLTDDFSSIVGIARIVSRNLYTVDEAASEAAKSEGAEHSREE